MTPQELQELIVTYQNALQSGQINKEEYESLIYGINAMEGIADDAEGLAQKEQINLLLNAAISAASVLA
jgi:hypothetical protein